MGSSRSAHASPVLELRGESVPIRVLLGDLLRRGHLLPMLAIRDFRSRYRSSVLGLVWGVLLPIFQGAVLAVVFTRVVRIDTGVDYRAFIIAGSTTWGYFAASFTAASTAIADQGGLAGRVYFPRMILPAIAALSNAITFVISLALVVLMMVLLHVPLSSHLALLPAVMVLSGLLAVVMGSVLAVLHVYVRDTRYVVTALMQPWFYATPVIYPLELTGRLQPLVEANPVTGVMQLLRWSLFPSLDVAVARPLLITGGWLLGLAVLALLLFRRFERVLCDRL